MSKSLKIIFCFLILATVSFQILAQEIILNHFDVIERTALTKADSSSIAFKSTVTYKPKSEGGYFKVLPIYSHTSYNSEYAYGFNDGYFWQGNGINQAIVIGVQGRVGNFEYTIAPQLGFAQNTEFDLRSDYGSQPIYQDRFANGIDYVKRYGNESFFELYFGQSELAYSYRNVRLSLNTQNNIWGPGIFSQGLMSNNANGFPNVRIGNDSPWNTRIGNLEMQWVFGITEESDYFNNDSSDDTQIHNGFLFGYKPSFFPGFSISLQRTLRLLNKDRENNLDYIKLATDFIRADQLDEQGNVNESADQIFSFGIDWRPKSEDFRVYLEWIRGDFFSDVPDFITQPEQNAGYLWGFIKKFRLTNESHLRLIFENTNLATWETARLRPSGSLYTHGQVR
ncbi:MAG: capsule assembly Wzi family protein, partial [Gracilimonas sp.]